MRELWLKVKQLARDASHVSGKTGSTVVRVQKRSASKEEVAGAAGRIMREHETALRWLADK